MIRELWHSLYSNKIAMAGIGVILFFLLIAILGANIRPDKSKHANDQHLEVARKKPGFSIPVVWIRKNQEPQSSSFISRLFFGGKDSDYAWIPYTSLSWSRDSLVINEFGTQQIHWLAIADVVFALDLAKKLTYSNESVMIPTLDQGTLSMNFEELKIRARQNLGTKYFVLGTDKFGRDFLSRLMAGTLVSLSVGCIAVLISLLIGITLGALAGFYRGWLDELIMWFINVVWSIPTVLLVIAITLALGKGFYQVFIAVGLTMWVEVARVVRGQMLSLREKDFVEAGRVLGFSNIRIIINHMLPNIFGPVIVISAANFATAILLEAGLSFLGIGTQVPMASWGGIIKNHYYYIVTDLSHLALLPGLAIMILVLAFMLVGNGLRDAMDVKGA
jgi:ABC-type dipeptide/oligopeptide/nickel transport system permease subunit